MIKAVIFDFDGVLAESVNIKTEAFQKIFETESTETLKKIVDYHIEHGGVSRFEKFRYIYREILHRPLSEEMFKELCNRFEGLVLEGVIASEEVKGATSCLNELVDRVLLFIVSGTPQTEMRHIVKIRGMEEYFTGVYGSPETKPELVRKILSANGLKPEEVVFIGDAMTDYNAAMQTGTGFIARTLPENKHLWKSLGVKAIINMENCAQEIGI